MAESNGPIKICALAAHVLCDGKCYKTNISFGSTSEFKDCLCISYLVNVKIKIHFFHMYIYIFNIPQTICIL